MSEFIMISFFVVFFLFIGLWPTIRIIRVNRGFENNRKQMVISNPYLDDRHKKMALDALRIMDIELLKTMSNQDINESNMKLAIDVLSKVSKEEARIKAEIDVQEDNKVE